MTAFLQGGGEFNPRTLQLLNFYSLSYFPSCQIFLLNEGSNACLWQMNLADLLIHKC